MWGDSFAGWTEEPLREHVLAGGPASHACRRGSGSTRGFNFFVLGGSFTRSGVDGTRGLGVGGLIRCAGRPREWSCGAVPPQERWHEGLGFVFWFGGFFHMLGGWNDTERRGAVAVCSEGGCGGMCWPVDRPATHAAAGVVSTRGFNFFVLGGSFTRTGVDGTRGVRVEGLIRCAGRALERPFGAVHAAGATRTRGLVCAFCLEVAPVSERDSCTR